MRIIDVDDAHVDLDELPIAELETLARESVRALRARYDGRRGSDIDERWCVGCGIRKVSGEDPDKPAVRRSSCDDCKAAFKAGGACGADPLRDILK